MKRSKRIGLGAVAAVAIAVLLLLLLLLLRGQPAPRIESHESIDREADVRATALEVAAVESSTARQLAVDFPSSSDATASEVDPAISASTSDSAAPSLASLTLRVRWESDGSAASSIAALMYYRSGVEYQRQVRLGSTDDRGEIRVGDLEPALAVVLLDRGVSREVELVAGRDSIVEFTLGSGIDTDVLVVDPAGRAVPTAEVWRVPGNRGDALFALGTTDANGYVRCRGLRLDDRLIAYHESHQPSAETSVCASTERCVTRLDLVAGGAARLVGRVVSETGDPIANAAVEIETTRRLESANLETQHEPLPSSILELATTSNGEFSTPPLARGRHKIQVVAKHFVRVYRRVNNTDVDLGRLEFHLLSGAKVEGVVRDATGLPCTGAYIWLETVSARSDSSGHYVLTGVHRNGGRLQASHETAGKTVVEVPVIADDVLRLDLALSQGRVIRGRVVREDDTPLVGWSVWLESDQSKSVWAERAVTGADGSFVLPNCRAEGNRLQVRKKNDLDPPAIVKLLDDVVADGPFLTIRIANDEFPSASISGRITGLAETTMRPTLLFVSDDDPDTHWIVRYDIDGSFEIGPMVPRKYRVLLQCDGGASREIASVELRANETNDLGLISCR
jgi:hypothetical protein